jgi:DNA-binding MarR family transcriptional regulator
MGLDMTAARKRMVASSRAAEPSKAPALQATQDDYVLTEQVGHLLRRAHQRHTAIFQDMIGQAQLTPTQYAALVKIRDLGEVSQNELGRMTAMDPATIQGVVQRLAARALIARRTDPDDRRCTLLSLSDAGRALTERAIERGKAITAATLEPLADAERAAFLALLRKLS